MKLHLSILSLSVVAMPVLSTELAKPVDVTFVSDWDDDVYSGGNIDTTSMTSKEKLQLPDLRFFETGQSGNVSMMRFLWNGKYHYECEVEVVKDPGVPYVQIALSEENDEFNYEVDKYQEDVTVTCEKVEGPIKLPSLEVVR